jgi:predicted Zn-dependent protease
MRAWAALLAIPLLSSCAALNDAMQKSGFHSPIGVDQVQSVAKVGQAFRKSAEDISESEEYYIGRAVAAQIASRYTLLDDAAANRYVQTVLQVVAMGSDRPAIYRGYHVQILDTPELNAFSTPGGFIFVTTGLLKTLDDEDQLAGVLGHELAHVAKKHGLKTIRAARLTAAFALLGQESAKNAGSSRVQQLTEHFGGAVDDIVNKLVVDGYSRDKEFEADHFGAVYAQRTEFDPAAASRYLAKLKALPDTGKGFFKTHPPAGKRLDQLGRYALKPADGFQPAPVRRSRLKAVLASL